MNNLKKGLLSGLLLLLIAPWLTAQIELEAKSNNGIKRVACGEEVFFFDDNTVDGILYADEEVRNDSIVICADGSKSPLTLYFHEFSIADGDNLEVYDGDITTSSPSLINNFSGHGVSATGGWTASSCGSANTSGCISFIFRTNGDRVKSTGWKAKVVCDPSDIKVQCVSDVSVQQDCPDSESLVSVSFKVPTITSCGGSAKLPIALSTCAAATVPSQTQSGKTITGKFPIGEHEVKAYLPGNEAIHCTFTIKVTQADFSCNSRVAANVGADCTAQLDLADLIKDNCYGAGISFDLSMKDKNGETKSISFQPTSSSAYTASKWEFSADLFDCTERYQVNIKRKVTYKDCDGKEKSYTNDCRSTIWLEDRTPPSITAIANGSINSCATWDDELVEEMIDYTVQNACGVSISSVTVGDFKPSACGYGTIPVTIVAEDHCGNIGRKYLNVNVQRTKRFVINQRKTVACGNSTHPSTIGYPYIDLDGDGIGDIELNQTFCDFEATYQDETQYRCGDSYKIRRIWSVKDLCTNKPPKVLAPQIIETNSLTCNGACDENGRLLTFDSSNVAMVSGTILSSPTNLKEVQINAIGANGYSVTTGVDENGTFSLPLPRYIDYQITATKDTEKTMGVSILDIIATLRHLVGNQPFTNTKEMIAADLNQSGTVTTMDVVNMRKLLLNEVEFDYPTWRFIPAQAMENEDIPFHAMEDYLQISYFENAAVGLNFQAIKMGDVSGSSTGLHQADARNQKQPLTIQLPDLTLSAGQIVDIPLVLPNITAVSGLQFSLQLENVEVLAIKEGSVSKEQFFQIGNRELKVLWDDFSANNHGNEHLLTLKVKANKAGKTTTFLSIHPTTLNPIAVDYSNNSIPVSLSFKANHQTIYNSPNPFHDQTTIVYELEESQLVSLQVFNTEGKLVLSKTHSGQKGQNQILLSREMLNTAGLLFYELKTSNQVFSNKMLMK